MNDVRSELDIFKSGSYWLGVGGPHHARLVSWMGQLKPLKPNALWLSSLGVSVIKAGVPDDSTLTHFEMLESAVRVSAASNIPLVVDMDAGYGGAGIFSEALQRICQIRGVAAVCIEDKRTPKKNSYFGGDHQPLLNQNEFKEMLNIAKEICNLNGVQTIARTEAAMVKASQSELSDRLTLITNSKADAVFFQSKEIKQIENIRDWSKNVARLPLVTTSTAYPHKCMSELHQLADVIIAANILVRAEIAACIQVLDQFTKEGIVAENDTGVNLISMDKLGTAFSNPMTRLGDLDSAEKSCAE